MRRPGSLAALVLYRGHLVAAALLLQLKTLLDNADGALARATGQVTLDRPLPRHRSPISS